MKLEALAAAKCLGQQPDRETAAWLGDLPDKLRDKLAVLRACAERRWSVNAHTLGDLLRQVHGEPRRAEAANARHELRADGSVPAGRPRAGPCKLADIDTLDGRPVSACDLLGSARLSAADGEQAA